MFTTTTIHLHHHRLLLFALTLLCLSTVTAAVKCYDCVGEDCVGQFCHGDYCMLSKYAPRWGTMEWGEPRTVKGCMSGPLLRKGVRNHCEAEEEEGEEVFTCFCDKNYCNGPKQVRKLDVEPIELYKCVCDGAHCKGRTCLGELCSYVVNHKTKETEQGCINASIPLIERRTAGACMMPPITGAMHHTIAKDAEALLNTESCTCAGNLCNREKPNPSVPERMSCKAEVIANLMGMEMKSHTTKCKGEFCFKVSVTSELGNMRSYKSIGCLSFIDNTELAEELNPTGCAKFESEQLNVEACFMTNDTEAIARAEEKLQPKHKLVTPLPESRRRTTTEESSEFEPAAPIPEAGDEISGRREEEEEREEEKPGKAEKEEAGEKPKESFIFMGPTEAPIPEDSNTTLVAVFVVIMVIIVIAGVIWKFELHKKVFRASYDTVAGG